MQRVATLTEHNGACYFGMRKGNHLVLSRTIKAGFLKCGGLLPPGNAVLPYEVRRNGSIILSGDVYDSEYFHTVVFHIEYSQVSGYARFSGPPYELFENYFQRGDELYLNAACDEDVLYDCVMNKVNSINSISAIIRASTQRFVEACKGSGIHVSLSSPSEPPMSKDYPGNVTVVNDFLL
jgi:hypothetical protein